MLISIFLEKDGINHNIITTILYDFLPTRRWSELIKGKVLPIKQACKVQSIKNINLENIPIFKKSEIYLDHQSFDFEIILNQKQFWLLYILVARSNNHNNRLYNNLSKIFDDNTPPPSYNTFMGTDI